MYSINLICDILDYLDININKKISVYEIAFKFSYNKFYVMKLFKRELGISLINYINCLRIYNSIKCIQNTNDSFTKIALCNGFYSLEYFSETFNKIIGVSPRIFQNYYKCRSKLSDKELYTVSYNWANLQNTINNITKYKKNKKPKGIPVLKRSIFD